MAAERFDLVVSEHGTAAWCDPERWLPEAARVLRPGGGIEFHPSHGDWVRLLRRSGFRVEALHEIYAPPDAGDHPFYEIVSAAWAARWPPEELWVATRT